MEVDPELFVSPRPLFLNCDVHANTYTCVDRRGRRCRMQSRTSHRAPTGTAVLPLLTLSVFGGDGVCLDVCVWAVGVVFCIMIV